MSNNIDETMASEHTITTQQLRCIGHNEWQQTDNANKANQCCFCIAFDMRESYSRYLFASCERLKRNENRLKATHRNCHATLQEQTAYAYLGRKKQWKRSHVRERKKLLDALDSANRRDDWGIVVRLNELSAQRQGQSKMARALRVA